MLDNQMLRPYFLITFIHFSHFPFHPPQSHLAGEGTGHPLWIVRISGAPWGVRLGKRRADPLWGLTERWREGNSVCPPSTPSGRSDRYTK